MATGFVGFVGPIVGPIAGVGQFLMAPVGRHFGYLFSYKSKVKNLNDEVKKLDEKRGAMQLAVDEAERNVKVTGPDVKGWLERVDKCSEEAREILKDEVEANKWCLGGWCPNLQLRYSLGKKATNKAKEVAKLHEERKLTEVAYNKPSPWIESTSTEGIKVFESRRLITHDVMEALKDDRFHMIAICGMGGVGKTTMAKEVAKRAKEEKLFDEVVMAVVSQSPNEMKIQGEIGDKLGLKFEQETKHGRAGQLRERLRGTKRILVILDDVWKRLELNDIGIPFGDGHRGCKILLTSRIDHVCNDMNAQRKFTVEVLTKEEAWNLFEEMAGISNDTSHTSTDLYMTQKKVADECGCLPIAIVTVARALNDKERHSWNSALLQLRKSMVKNIREVEEKVFKSLELSYDFLGSREIKECFLLCSLYAEDFNIPIEDLVRHGVGIELFEAIDSVDEARDRVHAFVDDLKKGYLLMDGERKGCVKMHDVVRDVALSIASKKEHSFMVRCDDALKEWPEKERHKNYAVISLQCIGMSELPDNLEFPELHLLRLEKGSVPNLPDSFYRGKEELLKNLILPNLPDSLYGGMEELLKNLRLPNLPDSFYGGMKELKALSMLNLYIEGSLPTSLQWLTNLRSLSLCKCGLINDVSVIGALENLEILSFEGTEIEELPKEIGRLSHLKLLDLMRCGVERICPGVLSSLSKLEELYLGSSFDHENRIEETKATLTELCGLSNFTTLVIHLRRSAYWPRDLVLTNLKTFAITISFGRETRYFCDYQLQNQFSLEDLHESDLMESGFKNLFNITKILEITRAVGVKNVGYDLDKDGFKKLTELFLEDCQDLEYVIETTNGVPVPQIAFPVLQSLRLHHLEKLKEICHGQLPEEAFSALKRLELRDLPSLTHLWKGPTQLVRLCNLTSLKVRKCDELESMFSLSIARDLTQLQELDVSECHKMEVLISSEEEGDQNEIASTTTETTDKIVFPKLKNLHLGGLPSFTALCKAVNGIELLQLNELTLSQMPKLNGFCNTSDSNYDTIQPLFNKVAFSALKKLNLWDVPTGTHLWKGPTQLVRLCNLTILELERCDKLESMFSLSIARDLMQLQILKVSKCRMMEVLISSEEEGTQNEIASTIVETTDKIVFPKLEELYLIGLPSFTALCKAMNGIELPQLNKLILWEMPKLNSFCNTSDSNYDIIQPLFNKVKLITIEKLAIAGMDNMIEIWPRELQPEVRYMNIWMCRKLSNILFPSNVIKGMQSLELLSVERCQSVEVAFDLEGIIVREGYPDIVLPSLTKLVLRYLPKLTHVWKSNLLRIPSFQNLASLTVVGCSSLRYIFSSSQARLLVKLQEIIVAACGVLEAIVNEEPKVDDEVATNIIMFPQLNSLRLYHLPNLKSLCPQAYTFEGSFFEEIKVINCPNMRALPSSLQRMLEPQERNVREVKFFNSVQHHLLDRKFSLSTKGTLDVTGIDEPTEIWHNQLEVGRLDKVRFMRVQCCGKLSSVVSSKLMQRLHNIRGLKVWWCDSLEMIFDLQEGVCADVAEKETLITQLSELKLKYLPELTHIWKNILQQTHCFQNLSSLRVQHCDNLRYIFTISMANVLVNLEYLTVQHCKKVEKIVTRENEEEIFSREIHSVYLANLPSLVCFGPDVNDTKIPAKIIKARLCPKFPGNDDGVVDYEELALFGFDLYFDDDNVQDEFDNDDGFAFDFGFDDDNDDHVENDDDDDDHVKDDFDNDDDDLVKDDFDDDDN
ncbi:disease resistance protein At4g27190-like isoform X2 [Camellia sinensis]|uniref:disease resistance protein At4g27190-like isoform X2 n=1 Tax=Camellia sinensis TaxID=4442 RepID=UPI0010364092|nr:disease resistance protein At4g27190-like isoform X2 [Camellia sinensis]